MRYSRTFLGLVLLIPAVIFAAVPAVQSSRGTSVNALSPGASAVQSLPPPIAEDYAGKVSGIVTNSKDDAQANVLVQFWKKIGSSLSAATSTNTDNTGRYEVQLSDGQWIGAACNSEIGFNPLFWEITVQDGKIQRFLESNLRAPVITYLSVGTQARSMVEGDLVTIEGSGFGCSGKVIVDILGYGQFQVTRFDTRRDNLVVFYFPALPQGAFINTFNVTYVHGGLRSNVVSKTLTSQRSVTGVLSPGF
jgi:hypothetical protein